MRFTLFIAPYRFMTIAPKIERNKRVAGSAIVGCDKRSASHRGLWHRGRMRWEGVAEGLAVRFTLFIAPYRFMTIAPKIERNERVIGPSFVGCDKRRASHRNRWRKTLYPLNPRSSIFTRHSAGPVWCTDSPLLSTATVTGMSATSNS